MSQTVQLSQCVSNLEVVFWDTGMQVERWPVEGEALAFQTLDKLTLFWISLLSITKFKIKGHKLLKLESINFCLCTPASISTFFKTCFFLLVFYILKIWSGHKYSTLLFLWCVCLIALKLKQFSPLMVFSIMLAGVGMVEVFFMQICSRSQKHTLLVHPFINIPCWNISTLLIGTYIHTFLVGTYFDIPYWNIYSNIPWWDIFQHSILEHVFKHSLMGHISTLHNWTCIKNIP